MRAASRLVPLLLLAAFAGCTTTTTTDSTPGEGSPAPSDDAGPADTPRCTADAARPDVHALPGTSATPPSATTTDDEGLVAVWYAGEALTLGRWGTDGAAKGDPFVVADGVTLPGGDARLSSFSVAEAGGKYVVAWLDATKNAVVARVVGRDGKGADARSLSPATREVSVFEKKETGPVSPTGPRARGLADGFFVTWNEAVAAPDGTEWVAVAQALDAAGAPSSKQAAMVASEGDPALAGDVSGGRMKVIQYRQGTGSVEDRAAFLRQASVSGDLSTWNETPLKLPQPSGQDAFRSYPTLVGADSGSIFVDTVAFGGAPAPSRVEIAYLDDLGAVTSMKSIDLVPAPLFVTNPVARLDGATLHVAWADSTDSSGAAPTLHDVMIANGGAPARIDVPLALAKGGHFDDLDNMLSGVAVAGGAVTFGFAWTEAGSRTRHLGFDALCLDVQR